jgi:hypothetical protein
MGLRFMWNDERLLYFDVQITNPVPKYTEERQANCGESMEHDTNALLWTESKVDSNCILQGRKGRMMISLMNGMW